MDFGIAKVLEAAHATNTQSVGTLQSMSPEQIDARTIDARSDLYALGLLLANATDLAFWLCSGGCASACLPSPVASPSAVGTPRRLPRPARPHAPTS